MNIERQKIRRVAMPLMAIFMGLVMVVAAGAFPSQVAEGKTSVMFAGHKAVRYDVSDIPEELRDFVQYVEYDAVYERGHDYGVRLGLTLKGSLAVKFDGLVLFRVEDFVENNPEWRYAKSDRSFNSLINEIQLHLPGQEINIEYFYDELDSREKLLFGK